MEEFSVKVELVFDLQQDLVEEDFFRDMIFVF